MEYSKNEIINVVCKEAETNGYNRAKEEIIDLLGNLGIISNSVLELIEELKNDF